MSLQNFSGKTGLPGSFQAARHATYYTNDLTIETTLLPVREDISFQKIVVRNEGEKPGILKLDPFQCYFGMLLSGNVNLYFPEIGKKQVFENDWFIGTSDGLPVQLEILSDVKLFAFECETTLFADEMQMADCAKLKLHCLACQERKQPFFEQGQTVGQLYRLANRIREMADENFAKRLLFEAKALEWLSSLLEQPELNERTNCQRTCKAVDEEALLAAAQYLETNLSSDHSIAKLSKIVHLNEFKLKKGFRLLFDKTVFGYLREKRMEMAGNMLRHSKDSVIEVANAVGYSNPSHFARAFKEHHGMLPKHFQKASQTGIFV